jgi:hypothetical protein
MSAKFAKILSVVGLSTFKHTMGGVPLAIGLFEGDYFSVVLSTAIGGILGVGFFLLLASTFSKTLRKWFPKKKPKKVFSRRNRFIVMVKKNFGLAGIAFLTPWFLSIPLGTFISYGIYKSRRKVFLYQSASIVFWSFAGGAVGLIF